jgi:hypothetical protein
MGIAVAECRERIARQRDEHTREEYRCVSSIMKAIVCSVICCIHCDKARLVSGIASKSPTSSFTATNVPDLVVICLALNTPSYVDFVCPEPIEASSVGRNIPRE